MKAPRVSIADLEFGMTWLECYDGQEDDANNAAAARLIAWLRAEVVRRHEDAAVRDVVSRTGVTPARARAALRDAYRAER